MKLHLGVLATVLSLEIILTWSPMSTASGIFTLRGKLKGFTDSEVTVQTATMVYEIKKAGLSPAQLAELKTKKTGQEVDLVVSTESVSSVHDVQK